MQIGERVWIIEREKNTPLSIAHLARETDTIPYEMLVRLEKGIRREIG
jgi:alanine racemase